MVYNRCVGTRYCSNNCPYKVRRFNFLQYSDEKTPVLKLAATRTSRCARAGHGEVHLCVQRNQRRAHHRREGGPADSGTARSRLPASRPARRRPIVFGDINDKDSRVSRLKAEPTNYGLLEQLNTRPRTTYLAKLRNRTPNLERDEGPSPAHRARVHLRDA